MLIVACCRVSVQSVWPRCQSGGPSLLQCLWQLYVWCGGGGGDGVRLVTLKLGGQVVN